MDLTEQTSTMPSLPPELFSAIFVRAMRWEVAQAPSIKQSPLVLTLVSKRWRTIALETPVLWSSLSYSVWHKGEAAQNGLDGVRAWLSRSGNVPLCLGISITTSDLEVANGFLDIYYAQRHRWKKIHLFLAGGLGEGLLPFPSNGFDKLEEINSRLWHDAHMKWCLPLYKAALPALRCLKHRELASRTTILPDISAHWPQLAHLDIVRNTFPSHSTDVLRQCANLETCRIYFRPGHDRPSPSSREPYTLPKLHSLWIRSKIGTGQENIFASITLPALRELEMVGRWWPLASFVPFLLRSRCPLRSLSLLGTNISEDDLVVILGVVGGTLESLEIGVQHLNEVADGCICATGKIIGMLNADSMGRDVLLPNATGLHFKSQGVLDWADGEFAAMIESRWRTLDGERDIVQIKNVTLTGVIAPGNEHKEDVQRLQTMEKQGLKLYARISES
ncbi:hypothetical protein DFH06DRAFT_1173838 [Mycena polygramma]|nr:hypothetical protein DFH06DRAFT_1173838 [Mycena polygramma]